jgi:hypothetical protein
VRGLQHGGSVHFVIEQPDGTRALLPAWMTEPLAAQFTIIEMPRLTLEALYALRSARMREECDDGSISRPPAAPICSCARPTRSSKLNTTTASGGSDVSVKAADGGAHRRRYGAAGRGQQ